MCRGIPTACWTTGGRVDVPSLQEVRELPLSEGRGKLTCLSRVQQRVPPTVLRAAVPVADPVFQRGQADQVALREVRTLHDV